MSIQILGCYARAGLNWNAQISLYCEKHVLPLYTDIQQIEELDEYYLETLDPDTDCMILYKLHNFETRHYIMGFECKATDLHSSLIGGDVSYEDEVIQHLVRNQSLTYYGAIVAGPQETHDIQMFAGCCSKHGVNWNWCNSIESAVKKMFEVVENLDRVIDCRKPIYINKNQEVPTFARMLSQFRGITGDRALDIYDNLVDKTPDEQFKTVDEYLESNSNLKRLWMDWFYNGIEPHTNLLKDPHKKKTARSEKA